MQGWEFTAVEINAVTFSLKKCKPMFVEASTTSSVTVEIRLFSRPLVFLSESVPKSTERAFFQFLCHFGTDSRRKTNGRLESLISTVTELVVMDRI